MARRGRWIVRSGLVASHVYCTGCAGSWLLHRLFLLVESEAYSLVVVHRFLTVVASSFQSMGARALGLQFWHIGWVVADPGIWSPGSVVMAHRLSCSAASESSQLGIKPESPALACRFLTTEPPGKLTGFLMNKINFRIPLTESITASFNSKSHLLVGLMAFWLVVIHHSDTWLIQTLSY